MISSVTKTLIFLSFLIFPIVTIAQITNVGLGYYGIQSANWKCDPSYKALKNINNIHLSFLYRTFGMNNDCLYRFIADPRTRSVEIHLTNGAGLRKAVLRWYELLPSKGYTKYSLEKAILARDRRIFRVFKRELARVNETILSKLRSDQACLVSPILEHDLSGKAFDILVRNIRPALLPGCLIVDSPDGAMDDSELPDIEERHGDSGVSCANCINNLDGVDITFDFRKGISGAIREQNLPEFIVRHKSDLVNFLWIREFNGYSYASLMAANEDPRNRTNFPTRQLISAMAKYIYWAETQWEIPKLTERNKKSFNGCTSPTKILPSGFRMYRNSNFYTTIELPDVYMEQFDSVVIEYNGNIINTLEYLNTINGKQSWTVDTIPYDLPYHIVIHAKNINNSTDECFYIKNPKTDIKK